MIIDKFDGEYLFLSNFYIHTDDGKSVEHFYQAAKTNNQSIKQHILDAATPALAKKYGRKCELVPDWDYIKVGTMTTLLYFKFGRPELREKLLNTGSADLIEGNWWGDTFWGVCNGVGQNRLGRLLMDIRTDFALQA